MQDIGLGQGQDELLQVASGEGNRHADGVVPEVQDDFRVDRTVLLVLQTNADADI